MCYYKTHLSADLILKWVHFCQESTNNKKVISWLVRRKAFILIQLFANWRSVAKSKENRTPLLFEENALYHALFTNCFQIVLKIILYCIVPQSPPFSNKEHCWDIVSGKNISICLHIMFRRLYLMNFSRDAY